VVTVAEARRCALSNAATFRAGSRSRGEGTEVDELDLEGGHAVVADHNLAIARNVVTYLPDLRQFRLTDEGEVLVAIDLAVRVPREEINAVAALRELLDDVTPRTGDRVPRREDE
jgi:hypothetical protein